MERPQELHGVRMTWRNLLFLHWRVPVSAMRPLVPEELEIDTFDGTAWVALVPFEMTDTSFRGVPRLPGLSRFYECNVRTYVRHRDRTGVWFFSLDAERLLPVLGGRWLWSLNYVHSRFEVTQGERTEYALTRRGWGPWPTARTRIVWTRGEELATAQPGSLEHFLTERYFLFTRRRGKVMAGRVEHQPWPLRRAVVNELDDTLVAAPGLRAQGEPHAMMSDSIEVVGYPLSS